MHGVYINRRHLTFMLRGEQLGVFWGGWKVTPPFKELSTEQYS